MIHGLSRFYQGYAVHGMPFKPDGEIASFILSSGTEINTQNIKCESILPSCQSSYTFIKRFFYDNKPAFDLNADESNIDLQPLGYDHDYFQNYRYIQFQNNLDTRTIFDSSNILTALQVGSRVLIEIKTPCTDEDFEEYIIMWDEGIGGDPTEVLVRIEDRSQLYYITDELSAGTYQFFLTYGDIFGNDDLPPAAYTEKISVTVVDPPTTPTVTYSYSAVTKKLTINSNATNTVVFSNNVMANGLITNPNCIHAEYLTKVSAGVFTTFELFPGDWAFNVHAINANGVLSDPYSITFTLVSSGGSLIQKTTVTPLTDFYAIAKAAAVIRLYWTPTTSTTVELSVSTDGITYSVITTTAAAYYDYSGVDATTYYFKARKRETQSGVYVYSSYTSAITITADGSAPTGDRLIEGHLI